MDRISCSLAVWIVGYLGPFLDYVRATVRMKADGSGGADLARTLSPSDLTLAGLVKHLAFVENYWFGEMLRDDPADEPWASVDWSQTPDCQAPSMTSQRSCGASSTTRSIGRMRETPHPWSRVVSTSCRLAGSGTGATSRSAGSWST